MRHSCTAILCLHEIDDVCEHMDIAESLTSVFDEDMVDYVLALLFTV